MDQELITRSRSHRGGYRVVSLLLLVFFLSPTDPVFLLLVPLGVFFVFFGGSVGIKLTGAVLTAIAFLALAPWQDGLFLVLYVSASSLAAALLIRNYADMDECLSYMAGVSTGFLSASFYLAASGWKELAEFEEKLGSEILEAGRRGISSGFYSFLGVETAGYERWLERGVEVFVYLLPGAVVLVSVTAMYLAATLLRSSSPQSADRLPEETCYADFRFNDHLLWVLTGGLILMIVPSPHWAKRLGANGAFVMGTIVLLRGIAVWVSYLGRRFSSPMVKAVFVLGFLIVFPPIAVGLALVIGLTDIWIDVRQLGRQKGAT